VFSVGASVWHRDGPPPFPIGPSLSASLPAKAMLVLLIMSCSFYGVDFFLSDGHHGFSNVPVLI
jgi:hypothetical protein